MYSGQKRFQYNACNNSLNKNNASQILHVSAIEGARLIIQGTQSDRTIYNGQYHFTSNEYESQPKLDGLTMKGDKENGI